MEFLLLLEPPFVIPLGIFESGLSFIHGFFSSPPFFIGSFSCSVLSDFSIFLNLLKESFIEHVGNEFIGSNLIEPGLSFGSSPVESLSHLWVSVLLQGLVGSGQDLLGFSNCFFSFLQGSESFFKFFFLEFSLHFHSCYFIKLEFFVIFLGLFKLNLKFFYFFFCEFNAFFSSCYFFFKCKKSFFCPFNVLFSFFKCFFGLMICFLSLSYCFFIC